MTNISVSGRLPDGDGNGLGVIARDLIREGTGEKPRGLHLCLALVDCAKVTINGDTHETVPVARIRRIEVIASKEDRELAERLMRRALEGRTGQETLPYDLELELSAVVDAVDLTVPADDEQPELPLEHPVAGEWSGEGGSAPAEETPAEEPVDTSQWPDDLSGLQQDDDQEESSDDDANG